MAPVSCTPLPPAYSLESTLSLQPLPDLQQPRFQAGGALESPTRPFWVMVVTLGIGDSAKCYGELQDSQDWEPVIKFH